MAYHSFDFTGTVQEMNIIDGYIDLYDCTVLKEFGPFYPGDHADIITINMHDDTFCIEENFNEFTNEFMKVYTSTQNDDEGIIIH